MEDLLILVMLYELGLGDLEFQGSMTPNPRVKESPVALISDARDLMFVALAI